MKNKQLQFIKSLYDRGDNIISFLKDKDSNKNSVESILISYDFQAGTYIQNVEQNSEFNEKYTKCIADVIAGLGANSIMEAGVGEATTFANVLDKLNNNITAYGFDLSWSRIKYAQKYITDKKLDSSVFLSTGNLFQMPFSDNSIDVVYTSHSIEPNGGKAKLALQELYRVAKKYVVLLEPAYELANTASRQRMEHHGYVTDLYESAKSLGYKVLEYKLFDYSSNHLNPTGLMIIEKSQDRSNIVNPVACPVTHTKLHLTDSLYFSEDSLLAYPILSNVPCLLADNAIVATHFKDF